MKKVLLLFACTALLCGCNVTKHMPKQLYDCKLALCDTTTNAVEPMTYSDDMITVSFVNTRNNICFGFKNKTSVPIYIDWDACSIIQNNTSKRVIHTGINFVQRNNPMAKTVVSPGTVLQDFVSPSENVYYYDGVITGYYNVMPGWMFRDMFLVSSEKGKTIDDVLSQKGQPVSFLLAFEIDGRRINKVFNFVVKDIVIL